jgi:hypothetical protein
MPNPYVNSNFQRVADDSYRTIDVRCVDTLMAYAPFIQGRIIDPCARMGSAIVDRLKETAYDAVCGADAFAPYPKDISWIVTNPPYDRNVVDDILHNFVKRVALKEVDGVAALLRSNFDYVKKENRVALFESPYYYGQIKLLFRPWWSEDHSQAPIHNFVWHIWTVHPLDYPIVLYGKAPAKP